MGLIGLCLWTTVLGRISDNFARREGLEGSEGRHRGG
jgi:hypothetical protein